MPADNEDSVDDLTRTIQGTKKTYCAQQFDLLVFSEAVRLGLTLVAWASAWLQIHGEFSSLHAQTALSRVAEVRGITHHALPPPVMGVSSSQPIPSSQDDRPTARSKLAAKSSLAKPAPRYSPTMDDEAASQQLMSEARANIHSANYEGPAIPLNFDAAPQDSTREPPSSGKKKAEKPGRTQKDHGKTLGGPSLSRYSLEDLQAFIGTSPSKSRAFTSTRPSTRIDVPDTQPELQANGMPSSTPLSGSQVVSSNASKKQSKQGKTRTKTVQAKANLNNGSTIPATPYEKDAADIMPSTVDASRGQASQKRRRKNKTGTLTSSSNPHLAEITETPEATQEAASRMADEDHNMQNGRLDADEQPLTPRGLLSKLKAERPQKSQSAGKATSQADAQEDAAIQADAEAERVNAASTAEMTNPPEPSVRKEKKTKKAKRTTKTSNLETEVAVQDPQVTPSQPLSRNDSNGEGPSSRNENASNRTTPSTKGRPAARYCINGVTRRPRVSRANPNNDYRRVPDNDERTAADKALEMTHELGHPADKRTSGDFTSDEKELIRRAIRDYQERSGLDTADLVEIIQWTSRRHEHDHQTSTQFKTDCNAFWDEIQSAGLLRTIKNIKKHVRATYHVNQRGRWSQEEDEQLRELSNHHPGQWKLIATQLNRLESDTYNRWKDYVRHGNQRQTKRWTVDEEEDLVRVLSLVCQRVENSRAESGKPPLDDFYPVINWHEVCREMGHTRSRLQCQSKWKIMISRNPPAALDIEFKPRTSAPEDAPEDAPEGASTEKRSSHDKSKKLGANDMLWGDKFDLAAEMSEQASSTGITSENEIVWRDVATSLGNKWSARTLKTAFKQLCELVLDPEDDDNLMQRLGSLFHYIKEYHSDELEHRYHAAQSSEAVDESKVAVNSIKKRKRQSDAESNKGPSKKQSKPLPKPAVNKSKALTTEKRSKPTPGTAVFKSKELVTDSESEL